MIRVLLSSVLLLISFKTFAVPAVICQCQPVKFQVAEDGAFSILRNKGFSLVLMDSGGHEFFSSTKQLSNYPSMNSCQSDCPRAIANPTAFLCEFNTSIRNYNLKVEGCN